MEEVREWPEIDEVPVRGGFVGRERRAREMRRAVEEVRSFPEMRPARIAFAGRQNRRAREMRRAVEEVRGFEEMR